METWTHLIKIEEEDDGWYVAQSVHAPNCHVWADSLDKVRESMVETIRSYQTVLLTGQAHGDFRIVEVEVPQHPPVPVRFIVQLTEDEAQDGGYTIHCPQLPGAVSQGDNEDEALEMIKDLISMYIEDIDAFLREPGEGNISSYWVDIPLKEQ